MAQTCSASIVSTSRIVRVRKQTANLNLELAALTWKVNETGDEGGVCVCVCVCVCVYVCVCVGLLRRSP